MNLLAEGAVHARDLTKSYPIYRRPVDRLIESITRRPRHQIFAALEDVSFTIAAGESVGIIGRNGAGKSTLLKLIAGVTKPTRGVIATQGRIASILELGTGFHPDFTGRGNAELNASILGLSPEEARQRLPDIFEFSELGDFLDRPVKTYSSGMYMRLAFSVAISVDPDLLIVDEALAVGDGHFQRKCLDRIHDFRRQGRTILFCSHAMGAVAATCDRTLWLDRGKVQSDGSSAEVIRAYEDFLQASDASAPSVEEEMPELADERPSPVTIRDVAIFERGAPGRGTALRTGSDVEVAIEVESTQPDEAIHVLLGVERAADQTQCFTLATHWDGVAPFRGSSRYRIVARLEELPLTAGSYVLFAFLGDESGLHVFDRRELPFQVTGEEAGGAVFVAPHRWEMR